LRESRVARGRLHVDVPQLFLHDPQVLRATQELRATRMPERVRMQRWYPRSRLDRLHDLPDPLPEIRRSMP